MIFSTGGVDDFESFCAAADLGPCHWDIAFGSGFSLEVQPPFFIVLVRVCQRNHPVKTKGASLPVLFVEKKSEANQSFLG